MLTFNGQRCNSVLLSAHSLHLKVPQRVFKLNSTLTAAETLDLKDIHTR